LDKQMKINLNALICGIIFGFGLSLSAMIDPSVVTGFLDITGNWNPALIFVMMGALIVTGISFHFITIQQKPICADEFVLPQRKDIDRPLIVGSILFGIGWGLAGICPGPAIAALALGHLKGVVFVIAMLIGMKLYKK